MLCNISFKIVCGSMPISLLFKYSLRLILHSPVGTFFSLASVPRLFFFPASLFERDEDFDIIFVHGILTVVSSFRSESGISPTSRVQAY